MTTFPDPHPLPGDPLSGASSGEVTIYEVGPRDGLQAETSVVPTPVKIEFIHRFASSGLDPVEVTSFVAPTWVPQLADADEVYAGVRDLAVGRLPVLVPNVRGLERALASGARTVAVFVSATESFAQQNLNAGREDVLCEAERIIARSLTAGVDVRGYVSMCFGDPWEGRVEPVVVHPIVDRLLSAGCYEVSLGDTIGVATPGHVRALLTGISREVRERLALHAHDTYGQALANALTALDCGVRVLDSAAGGLGGCPFAKSATGNLATEDLVWMLEGLGVATGVDLGSLALTSTWMAQHLGRPSSSAVVRALTGPSGMPPRRIVSARTREANGSAASSSPISTPAWSSAGLSWLSFALASTRSGASRNPTTYGARRCTNSSTPSRSKGSLRWDSKWS